MRSRVGVQPNSRRTRLSIDLALRIVAVFRCSLLASRARMWSGSNCRMEVLHDFLQLNTSRMQPIKKTRPIQQPDPNRGGRHPAPNVMYLPTPLHFTINERFTLNVGLRKTVKLYIDLWAMQLDEHVSLARENVLAVDSFLTAFMFLYRIFLSC